MLRIRTCSLHIYNIIVVQAVRPELADKDEHEDQTGLESLMEGDQKHHTQLPGATTDGMCASTCTNVC